MAVGHRPPTASLGQGFAPLVAATAPKGQQVSIETIDDFVLKDTIFSEKRHLRLATQRASIDALVDTYRQQSERERQSMTVARWALMRAVVAETVDTAQISEAAVTVWEL